MNETELLRQYAQQGSEAAFAELVKRHIDLVYSAALRQVGGDRHLAQDVVQSVFVDLARKAGRLGEGIVLAGWLYTGTRYAAAKAVRSEARRRVREQEAHRMQESLRPPTDEPGSNELFPVLDEAMHELNEHDRNAVLLRYFEQRPLAEVGSRLGVSEDAARMRVDRALVKLRALLERRGITCTGAALTAMLTTQTTIAAPAAMAALVTKAALSGSAASGGGLILQLMTMTKIKAGLVGAVVLGGLTATVLIESRAAAKSRQYEEAQRKLDAELASLRAENERLQTVPAGDSGDLRLELQQLRVEAALLQQQADALPALHAEAERSRQNSATRKTPLQRQEETIAAMSQARQCVLAFLMYANANGGRSPETLGEAASAAEGEAAEVVINAATQFEIVYQGSINAITNAAETIVLRQKDAWQGARGVWTRLYAFADGHVEAHAAPDGDFASWEAERMVPSQ